MPHTDKSVFALVINGYVLDKSKTNPFEKPDMDLFTTSRHVCEFALASNGQIRSMEYN